ncbi:hypothetical protein VSH64_24795 [Amycolatopsis rhabdoformis]|uniref:Holin n=1 Tax=Amycolatopsis rhabdoformis TaxID=1448059 RepID=A0ABZ1HX47_9PSEU|nr:hypothetical protein [Amycolatopsis rhabdoformis]WSE26096.1 hypothetical protein VSH64_24795 [Amycolatopsis rhabdoformis]
MTAPEAPATRWQKLAAWVRTAPGRFRKAFALVGTIAAIPGVLGLLNLIPGVEISAGTFATVVAVAGALAGGGVVAAVPNKPSLDDALRALKPHGLYVSTADPAPAVDPLIAEDVPRTLLTPVPPKE